ncbi:MAG TPA: alpha/beta fold hydrolase [Kineosporiaceae bacterium]|nr:alpha/beta fold hydrolase [Kineosporiaceae bacterium]
MGESLCLVAAADGRSIGVAQWGDPRGTPVLSLHGTPGSRLSRPPDEQALRHAGIHLITYDRPGYGASDRAPGRRVVDCVGDVEAIIEALGIARFAVSGRSGGGPHALAVAARLPDRVALAECVVGAAPFDASGLDWTAGMDAENVEEFAWVRQGEQVLHRELARVAAADLERMTADPAKVFSDDWQLADADRQVLARSDVQRVWVEAMREAHRPGVWGWVDDDLAFLEPWGFDVNEIRVPVTVRYGRQDVLVPAAHGAWLADHVPGADVVVDDQAGHLVGPEVTLARMAVLAAGVGQTE